MPRPSLEEYYMMLAFIASTRTTCLNRAVGAVLTTPDNKHILATAYNGAPAGLPHCENICHRRELGFKSGEGLHKCRAAHAEQNIFTQLARNHSGGSKDAILYITHSPCNECCKLIINSGIKKVVYSIEYPNPESINNLKFSGIEIEKLNKENIMNKINNFIGILN
ncbi:MAG: deoxycytidylate deaminase [archaeon]